MDKLDWKILRVLDWNGREPINKIAKQVKSNKDVVRSHQGRAPNQAAASQSGLFSLS